MFELGENNVVGVVHFMIWRKDTYIHDIYTKMFECTSCSRISSTPSKCTCGSYSFYYIERVSSVTSSK
jgi:hypothetical protein